MIVSSYGVHNPIINHLDLIQRVGKEFVGLDGYWYSVIKDRGFSLERNSRAIEFNLHFVDGRFKSFIIHECDISNKPLEDVIKFIRECYEIRLRGPKAKPDPLRSKKGAFE
jgi:hypothetical protein